MLVLVLAFRARVRVRFKFRSRFRARVWVGVWVRALNDNNRNVEIMLQGIIQGNLVPRMLYYSSLSGSRGRIGSKRPRELGC